MSDVLNIGIDLGTTNSAIAEYDGNEVKVFKNRDQMDVTPSVVRLEKTGRIVTGRRAYQTLLEDPENVAAEFKRWMGQSDTRIFKESGKKFSAEELSAEILKSLLDDARRQTGKTINSAVITVPAAFGQLQCEATGRAASLAGLEASQLLQEPIAASIAYGMKLDAQNKRWLIYDLGGGTFDIAIVSTKDGQLSVLEHRGNNMLGGKDFDRLIVKNIFLPKLKQSFKLEQSDGSGIEKKLIQALHRKAEEAKIDLTFSDKVIVSIFNVGNDESGKPVEGEFEVTRTEIEKLITPLIVQTVTLCREALNQARLTKQDLTSVILVGGPTQMPIVREMLKSELGIPLDYSIDPMTVVARGASVYASTVSWKQPTTITVNKEGVHIDLAHENVWSELTTLVAGRISDPKYLQSKLEVMIEAETGHWNSGWLPVKDGYFETSVNLLEGKMIRFWIYLRDEKGKQIVPEPDNFSIRHGLTLAEPPLPHSIGAEVVRSDGTTEVDVIFQRSTRLPAQKVLTYKANKTIKPTEEKDYIAIKLWEGEFPDPVSNTFVGVLQINSSDIKRSIPVGTDIELSISIDASRCMKVNAFIPLLNQHFNERVYVAKNNDPNFLEEAKELGPEISNAFSSIRTLVNIATEGGDTRSVKQLEAALAKAETLENEHRQLLQGDIDDPDEAKKIIQQSKEVRGQIGEINKSLMASAKMPLLLRNFEEVRSQAEEIVRNYGDSLEQKEYDYLSREAGRYLEIEDGNKLEKVSKDMESLKWRVLYKQEWFWKSTLEMLSDPSTPFVDLNQARGLLEQGREAVKQGNADLLRNTVLALNTLLPKAYAETQKEMALASGIKKVH